VDPVALGALGFSGAGLAPLVMAMRDGDVDAVAQLETGFFGPQGSSYRAVPGYDPAALRKPYFYAHGVTLAAPDLHLAEIQKMRYATRAIVYTGEPRMHHWDLATEGPAAMTRLARRPEARRGVFRATSAIYRHLLTFFDAHVRRRPEAQSKLFESFQEPGPGAMVDVQILPAIEPALSRREFRRLLDEDAARAGQLVREGLTRDPQAAVFEEEYLNSLGYELLNQRQADKAIEVFRLNVDAHPSSANALDSLSEGLELLGRRAEAIDAAEKALAALPNDTAIQAPQRRQIEDGLRARLGRLKK
jgi:tetratricopeptide (TPR) repeat protein